MKSVIVSLTIVLASVIANANPAQHGQAPAAKVQKAAQKVSETAATAQTQATEAAETATTEANKATETTEAEMKKAAAKMKGTKTK